MARFCMRTFLMLVLPVALLGCAQGFEGNGDDGDDDSPRVDAPLTPIDARIVDAPAATIDAPTSTIDAPTSTIDAPTSTIDGGTGLFCNTTADCAGQTGTCCFFLIQPPGFCVPGTETLGVCIPE